MSGALLAGLSLEWLGDLVRDVFLLFAVVPAAAGAAATWIAVRLARRHALLDQPNVRSSHAVPTPRTGGVGIVAAMAVVMAMCLATTQGGTVAAVLAAVLVAAAVGLWDDLRTLPPRGKMAGLLLAAAVAATVGRVEVVHGMPWIGDLDLAWAAWPLTLFWVACYANAFNFMDGIDGIAGGTAFVSAAVYVGAGYAPLRAGHDFDGPLLAVAWATAVASLGFLPWNFPRARTFMGDVGSLPLGLALAFCAVRANDVGALSFPASVLLLGPFLFDVTFTLVRRALRGERLGQAHREHPYQRLARVLGSHAPVTLLYCGFSVVTGLLALSYDGLGAAARLLSLGGAVAAMLAFAAIVLRVEARVRT